MQNNFSNENLTVPKHHSSSCKKRIFRYVTDIPRCRGRAFKSAPSIRSLHQVQSTSNRCEIMVRRLSCYNCNNCIAGVSSSCSSIAGSPTHIKMKHENKDVQPQPENEITENSLKILILPGAILAVYTDDENEDSYLVLCKGEERILDVDTHDDWGNLFCC